MDGCSDHLLRSFAFGRRSNAVQCIRPLERLSCPPDHLLLRKQTWLLSSAVHRPRGILWRCVTEEIGVPAASGVRSRAPVRIGDTVVARASVKELETARRRVTLATVCTVGDKKVLDGEATLMLPSRPNGSG